MEAGVESVSSAVRRFIGFHLCKENTSEFCQEGWQKSHPYPEEAINEVLPPFNNHEKFCILHVSTIQSILLSVSLTPK